MRQDNGGEKGRKRREAGKETRGNSPEKSKWGGMTKFMHKKNFLKRKELPTIKGVWMPTDPNLMKNHRHHESEAFSAGRGCPC